MPRIDRFNKSFILALCFSSLSACGGGGGGGGSDPIPTNNDVTPTQGGKDTTADPITDSADTPAKVDRRLKFGASDFDVTPTVINEDKLVATLKNKFFSVNQSGVSDDVVQEDISDYDKCMNNMLDPYRFKQTENGFYEVAFIDLNITDCGKLNETGLNMLNYETSLYLLVRENDSLGNSINLDNMQLIDSNRSGLSLSSERFEQTEFKYGFTYEKDGASANVNTRSITLYSSTSDPLQTCKVNDVDKIILDCMQMNLVTTSITATSTPGVSQTANTINKTVLITKGLSFSEHGTYNTGGVTDFTINNWTGRVTFHDSDTEVPPTYTATNGQTTIQGTIGQMTWAVQ